MLEPKLTDDFAYIVDKFGAPETLSRVDGDTIYKFSGRLPNAILDFWRIYGFSQFWDGLLRVCNPDEMRGVLELAFENDADLDPMRSHIVAYSAFGELLVWSEKLQRIRLTLADLELRCRVLEDKSRETSDTDRSVAFLFGGEKSDSDMTDMNGKLLYSRCQSRHGALEADECYGFFPALLMGGEAHIDNVRRVKALEHFAILAQLDRPTLVRIRNDGTTEPIRQIG